MLERYYNAVVHLPFISVKAQRNRMGKWMVTIEMAWGLRIIRMMVIDRMQITRQTGFVDTQATEPHMAGMYFFASAGVEA